MNLYSLAGRSWMTAAFIKISARSNESISGANSSITLANDRPFVDRRGEVAGPPRAGRSRWCARFFPGRRRRSRPAPRGTCGPLRSSPLSLEISDRLITPDSNRPWKRRSSNQRRGSRTTADHPPPPHRQAAECRTAAPQDVKNWGRSSVRGWGLHAYADSRSCASGSRDILGIWAGDGGEGAYWLPVFTELGNRGLDDVLMPVCDGLRGLPDTVETVWPRTIMQTRIVHLLRNSFRYASRADWDKIAKALKPVYTAPTEDAATKFAETWGKKSPAIVRVWESAWAEFVPFLPFDVEIRTVICSTNAIESVNARLRKAVRARGYFPTEAAALKCVYLALTGLDPSGKGRKRWAMRWKALLNAFQIAFEGRLTPADN